ncbi:hypothetical protein F5Y09DRAFT_357685 [Xylaria sp. FL1042]|nr:hypothetical protein F5Y09DRAFT_357685 [Xylaria sp. FL1042]
MSSLRRHSNSVGSPAVPTPDSPADSQPRASFLGLSPEARELIYLYAGVIVNKTVSMNRERLSEESKSRYDNLIGPSPLNWHYTLALLQTCRRVYAEVSSLIYSTNRFITRDLNPLRKLSPSSLSSLTSLKIQVRCIPHQYKNHPDCNLLYSNKDWDYGGKLGTRDVPYYSEAYYRAREALEREHEAFDSCSPCDARLLDKWVATASHIGSHIKKGQLELSVICDVKDLKTADLVLAPLRQWPLLSRCSIRLSSVRNDVLYELARSTSRALMGFPDVPPSTFHRYLQLPPELRLNVLQYTDLVTPWTHVYWLHDEGFVAWMPKCCSEKLGKPPIPPGPDVNDGLSDWMWDVGAYRPFGHSIQLNHDACRFRPCKRDRVGFSGTGCFCSIYHAAYTPSCNCWRSPRNLFMVSKQFNEEAWFVFWSSNYFDFPCQINFCGTIGDVLFNITSPNRFENVKSLKLNLLDYEFYCRHMPSSKSPEAIAQVEWRRFTSLISSRSNIRYLSIETTELHFEAGLINWRNLKAEEAFLIVRQAINTRLWPLDEAGPPRGVQLLRVHLGWSWISRDHLDVCYSIRPENRPVPDDFVEIYLVPDRVSFCRSIVVEGDDGISTWIEEVWIGDDPPPYDDYYEDYYQEYL